MFKDTSWNKIAPWYNKNVGVKGHYYHEQVILPNLKRLLGLRPGMSVLDLGCGQGILARNIPKGVNYLGVDLAEKLLDEARKLDKDNSHQYLLSDITKPLPGIALYDRVVMMLSLQNVAKPFGAIKNAKEKMKTGGKLIIVMNHPAFRIPQHSDWMVDKEKRIQKRVEDVYMSPTEIKIESRPFDKVNNKTSLSYHYPLSAYSEMFFDNGMVIEKMEEWVSNKKSEGGAAMMEDKARREFPMFLAIVARV